MVKNPLDVHDAPPRQHPCFRSAPLTSPICPSPRAYPMRPREPQTTVNHSDSFAAFCRHHGVGARRAMSFVTTAPALMTSATVHSVSITFPRFPGQPSNPRPIAAPPMAGGRFITTKPARSKCRTSRFATMSAMNSAVSFFRRRPSNLSANASASASVRRFHPSPRSS